MLHEVGERGIDELFELCIRDDEVVLVVPGRQPNAFIGPCIQLVEGVQHVAHVENRSALLVDAVENMIAEEFEWETISMFGPAGIVVVLGPFIDHTQLHKETGKASIFELPVQFRRERVLVLDILVDVLNQMRCNARHKISGCLVRGTYEPLH